MDEKIKEFPDIEEEYLDLLIKLAYDMDDLDKEQQIREEAEEASAGPDEQTIAQTWQTAREKIDRFEKEEKQRARRAAFRRTAPQVLKIAACLLLVMFLSVPVVLATSAEFRSRVINLLYSIDHENQVAHFEFTEDPGASFTVPAGWTGDYFLSYIPEGMELTEQSELFASVNYRDTSGRGFAFSENDDGVSMATGTEGQTVRPVDINGSEGVLIEGYMPDGKERTVTLVWSREEKWFELSCHGLEADEALKMARSVRKIIH